MIALERVRTTDKIHLNFRGAKRIAWNKELLNRQKAILIGKFEAHNFKQSRWKEAKTQLFAESGDKCAYCEAQTRVVSHGDVEHFRPKSKYWWLAYCYDNYLVACQVCNSVYKGNEFPILDELKALTPPNLTTQTTDEEIDLLAPTLNPDPIDDSGLKLTDFIKAYHTERPLLLNPYFDDPSEFFAWKVETVLEHVILIPKKTKYRPYIEAAEKYYGLNRKELKESRYYFYEIYNTLYQVLDRVNTDTRQEIENRIIKMKDKSSPFSGMIRYFDLKNRGI
jgi:uncharacterized protein (TIGR02646 family)